MSYTVSQLCSALKFPKSTYYEALVRVPSNRQSEYDAFSKQVKLKFDESKQRYGAVKIWRALNADGTACSLKRVQRHMQKQELRSVVVKNITITPIREPFRVIKKTSSSVTSVQKPSTRSGVRILPTSMC